MELLDIVDENDRVTGQAERKEIYARKLRHRIVHVLVFNQKGEMALQLRSMTVAFCPGHWSTAVGGHVLSGETYEEAAVRESKEEIGMSATLEFFAKDDYTGNGISKFVVAFRTTYDGPFTYEDGEAADITFLPVETIRAMIQDGQKFHPELLFLLEKYFRQDGLLSE